MFPAPSWIQDPMRGIVSRQSSQDSKPRVGAAQTRVKSIASVSIFTKLKRIRGCTFLYLSLILKQ